MEQILAHSSRSSMSGSRSGRTLRKPAKRSQVKMERLLSRGVIVPISQLLRKTTPLASQASSEASLVESGFREQEWVRSNWREYQGNWVALANGGLVAKAAGAREALEKAKAAGVSSPFIVHVTEPSNLPFGGW